MAGHSNLGMQEEQILLCTRLLGLSPGTTNYSQICAFVLYITCSLICTLHHKWSMVVQLPSYLVSPNSWFKRFTGKFDMLQLLLFSWHQIWKCTYYGKNVVKGILTPQSAFSRVQWSSKCCESVSTYEVNRHTNQKKKLSVHV